MKKFSLFLMLMVASVFFYACSNTEENVNPEVSNTLNNNVVEGQEVINTSNLAEELANSSVFQAIIAEFGNIETAIINNIQELSSVEITNLGNQLTTMQILNNSDKDSFLVAIDYGVVAFDAQMASIANNTQNLLNEFPELSALDTENRINVLLEAKNLLVIESSAGPCEVLLRQGFYEAGMHFIDNIAKGRGIINAIVGFAGEVKVVISDYIDCIS